METVQAVQADLVRKLQALAWLLRKAGPYVAIEILLPGGTLIALLLYLYRRRNAAPDPRMLALKSVAARVMDEVRQRAAPVRGFARMRAIV